MGDVGLIPGLGRSPGEGNRYPLQYSGLEKSMDRGAWGAIIHGVTESDMTEHRAHPLCVLYFISFMYIIYIVYVLYVIYLLYIIYV